MPTIDIGPNSYDRRCSGGILESYLTYAMPQESPTDFHIWVCISMIASALGRNCYCSTGMYETYPNLYIILVGESAITHKSTAINMGYRHLHPALPEIPLLGDCMTVQAFTSTLADIAKEEGGVGRSEGIMTVSELSDMLGNAKLDDTFVKRLTDLWDSPDYRKYRTIGRGVEELKDVCVNIIAGTTPKWLRSSLPESSLEGGFFSRLILVQRPPKGEKNPFPILTTKQKQAIADVVNDLQCIRHNMQGEFHFNEDALQFFDEWYHEHNHPEKAHSFMRGYYGRKGDFMQKLAMCISANFSDDMIVTLEDVIMAHKLLNENEKYTEGLVKYMGTTDTGAEYMKVRSYIKRNVIEVPSNDTSGYTEEEIAAGMIPKILKKGISHSELQRKLGHRIRTPVLAEIIDGLYEAEEIDIIRMGKRSAKYYIWKGVDSVEVEE